MTAEEFSEKMKEILSPIYSAKGEVIYSKAYSFKKGKYYLIGLNPGCFNNESLTVGKCVEGFLVDQNEQNYYLDTLGKLKNNIEKLFSKNIFGNNFDGKFEVFFKDIFVTNLIFTTTKNADGIKNYKQLVDICWPVHELALKEVNPEVIICIGNGDKSSYTKFIKTFPIVSQTWKKRKVFGFFFLKACEIEIDGKTRLLIGLPHLSWIKNFEKQL